MLHKEGGHPFYQSLEVPSYGEFNYSSILDLFSSPLSSYLAT